MAIYEIVGLAVVITLVLIGITAVANWAKHKKGKNK